MKYDPQKHHRRSIRLKGYDYSQAGAYFVTICTHNRECVLGEIVDGEVHYSSQGQIAHDFWAGVGVHFSGVLVPSFIVMPNHVHAMIIIRDIPNDNNPQTGLRRGVVTTPLRPDGTIPCTGVVSTPLPGRRDPAPTGGKPAPAGGKPDLGHIVAFYKYQTTKHINARSNNPGVRFWQRNYYEHIVRNDDDYQLIIEYVQTNPLRWEADQLHPAAAPNSFNRK